MQTSKKHFQFHPKIEHTHAKIMKIRIYAKAHSYQLTALAKTMGEGNS
jgi:hypothetical protein